MTRGKPSGAHFMIHGSLVWSAASPVGHPYALTSFPHPMTLHFSSAHGCSGSFVCRLSLCLCVSVSLCLTIRLIELNSTDSQTTRYLPVSYSGSAELRTATSFPFGKMTFIASMVLMLLK